MTDAYIRSYMVLHFAFQSGEMASWDPEVWKFRIQTPNNSSSSKYTVPIIAHKCDSSFRILIFLPSILLCPKKAKRTLVP